MREWEIMRGKRASEVGAMSSAGSARTMRWAQMAALALAIVFATAGVAYASTPTSPDLFDAYPNGSGQVVLKWVKSTDADPTHVLTYQIFRSQVPITQAMINASSPLIAEVAPVSLISTEPTITATVNAVQAEIDDAYVWYYAVRAKDSTNLYSLIQSTLAPNLHGNRTTPKNIDACGRCHSVHGAPTPPGIVDRSSWICYYCHGRVDNSSAGPGDRSTYNTKADFYDYGNLPSGGSQHRGAKMSANNTQCLGCHTAHRASYYFSSSNGTTIAYDPLQSFRLYLRVQTGFDAATQKPTYANGYLSSNNVATESTAFCFSCHGSTTAGLVNDQGVADGAATTNMAYVSDTGYVDTAGDHNEASYATSAHGTGVIKSNDYGRVDQGDFPQVQCLACHDKHASAADKLIAYRSQDTTTTNPTGTFAQANLCYACHSAGSTETKVVGSTAPFAWNGRDVKSEFTKTSSHPTTINTATTPTRVLHDTWSDTTQAEFQAYGAAANLGDPGLYRTSYSLIADAITLAQTTGTADPGPEPRVYANSGGTQTFDAYDTGSGVWNDDGFNPDNHDGSNGNSTFTATTGSSSFWLSYDNRLYTTGGGGTSMYVFNPAADATGDWDASGVTLPVTIADQGDTAVNGTATNGECVYFLAGGGVPNLGWWKYTPTAGTGTFYFRTGATPARRNLGIGAAIAYAPGVDRLFVLYENGSSGGDGCLYYKYQPNRPTNGSDVDFLPTSGAAVVSNGGTNNYYNRMTYFKKDNVEYLMVIGRDTTGRFTKIVSNLDQAAPTVVTLSGAGDPFGGSSLGQGCDLEWDGGDYIYAVRGGGNSGFVRIKIPTSPGSNASWGTAPYSWANATAPVWTGGSWANGSSIAIGTYDRPPYSTTIYYPQGSANAGDIAATAPADRWAAVNWTEAENTGDFTLTVQGWNGASWIQLVAATDTSPIDLSSFLVADYPKIRLVGNFTSSADQLSSPVLYDWSVTTTKLIQRTSRSATCANCHNVHSVSKGSANAWDATRVSDPANTKNSVSASIPTNDATVNFCLGCHGTTLPTTTANDATHLVPYNPSFRGFAPGVAVYFPGWGKSVSGLEYASSGHFGTTGQKAKCQNCHDPHASSFRHLTAWTMPTGATGLNAGTRANNDANLSREENLCYQCHGNGTIGKQATGAANVATPANPASGTNNKHVMSTYADRHEDTESAADAGGGNRHSECTDCHDPHVAKKVGGTALHDTAFPGTNSSAPGTALLGAWGAIPGYANSTRSSTSNPGTYNWGIPGASTPLRFTGAANQFEAYLCIKCHSNNTAQPSGQSNVAQEFNPSNASSHNVLGQSVGMQSAFTVTATNGTAYTTTWALPVEDRFLIAGLTANSMITCTDCHTSDAVGQAVGPHGSTASWLLDPDYPSDWKAAGLSGTNANGMSSTAIICAKCHDLNGRGVTGSWSNNVHAEGSHQGTSRPCITCHVKVPHGWARPRLLGTINDNPAYAATGIAHWPANVSFTLNTNRVDWGQNSSCGTGGTCGTEHAGSGVWWPDYP